MRPHARSLAIILGSVSVVQAAAYDRRQEPVTSTVNLADGFMSMFNRLGGGQTVTETVRQTITVGAGGGVGAGVNATGAVTVTVTAAASTVTLCPGQAQGAVEGVQGGGSASAAPGGAAGPGTLPVVVASGGIGVTVISVPEEARKTSAVGNQPAASQPAVSQPAVSQPAVSEPALSQPSASSLAPLPSQGGANQPGLVTPPGLSATPSATSLAPLPSVQTPPAAAPIVGAPASDSSAAASATSLAPLPGLASSLSNTLSLPSTDNAAAATPIANPAGAFGGSAGVIPMASAAIVPPSATTPVIANGAGAGPTIDVSGLTLSSQLNLGNLAQATTSIRA